jgi:pantoate--beta-alanine ligase
MKIFKTIKDIREFVKQQKKADQIIGFVPTMGALHEGHLALTREAKRNCDIVIASIFVNPAQFAPNEDFDSYPRDHKSDISKLEQENCNALFIPEINEIYNKHNSIEIKVNRNADILCGKSRPHFFHGVALIVTKLLNIVTPDKVFFGEKDFQQLSIIKSLSIDLNINTEVVGVKTIRENDGLALSSRNEYLSKEERKIANEIYREINILKDKIIKNYGKEINSYIIETKENLLRKGFNKVDYLEVRSEEDLELYDLRDNNKKNYRIFIAAFLGKTRLIDNLKI